MKVGEGYRQLGPNDIRMEGDEYSNINGWSPIYNKFHIKYSQCSCSFHTYRRKIEKDTNMKINGHTVEIKHDSIQVGCTTVTREQVESILKQMNAKPKQKFPEFSTKRPTLKEIQEKFKITFLEIRDRGNYENKGFYLGEFNMKVVKDNRGLNVLIFTEDEIK